jgi:hypothetical protein
MKLKTSELHGAALDWAVAKCEGYVVEFRYSHHRNESWVVCDMHQDCRPSDNCDEGRWQMFVPSNVWQDGGPIIQREKIGVSYDTERFGWVASFYAGDYVFGGTPLVAAMRCYVASKLGDEVEVPDQLLQGEIA